MSDDPLFDRAVALTLGEEGGYIVDLRDHGGETKFGISKRAYPDVDIKALTRADAIVIYRRDYWDRARCCDLPAPVALIVFDAAVNQGVGAAIRMLQEAVRTTPDGVFGPATFRACAAFTPAEIAAELTARRCRRYALSPDFPSFGLGWMRRACHMLAAALAG